MRLPVHRWIRYSAGFSGAWAESVIRDFASHSEARVFDPFAGSGTTLIAAENAGCVSAGVEAHPFVFRLADAKLARRAASETFCQKVSDVIGTAKSAEAEISRYPALIRRCFSDEVLADLDKLRAAVALADDGSAASRLVWLALVGILRRCSHAGTAQWQYVLPKRTKKSPSEPFPAFAALCQTMMEDLAGGTSGPAPVLIRGDARDCAEVPDGFATLVLTSPPYPNNYDYADATRLEMCFFQEIEGWGDLQSAVRRHLVRSCSQHVPERAVQLHEVLDDVLLQPIHRELTEVCQRLAEVRLTKGGKKTYHLMVACYFADLAKVWHALRRVCDSPSRVCFVIGDSAPYGVYVPVIEWFGALALSAGFESFEFERTRDRNVKWKNRKHRVPLCEGRLWVKG
ncbi:site-specific DNA-methyltransferase [Candidatus Poribacteria bacterium]|nr:site-specific DNA-methyltransferase [Candidatus Poribacteria bacterium]